MPAVPASHRDLLDARVATLATIGPDGRPQLSAVWFVAQGDTVALSLNTNRQKVQNLMRDRACCLFILDVANPMRYLEIRGDAAITADDERAFATRVGAKYDTDVSAYDAPGDERVVVTIVPARINAVHVGA